MMFGRKRKEISPEVQEAMAVRDELLADVEKAVSKVDRLQEELLEEYRQANGIRKEQHESE